MQTAKLNFTSNLSSSTTKQQQNSPEPPTPPPISHLPSFNRSNNNQSKSDDKSSINNSSSPSKTSGKKNLIKTTQDKIEAFKISFQQNNQTSSNSIITTGTTTITSSSSLSSNEFSQHIPNSDSYSSGTSSNNKFPIDNNSQTSRSSSAENSPTKQATKSNSSSPSYKGRVSELKNCISKINSRGLFSLSSSSSHSSSASSSSSTSTNSTIKNSSGADNNDIATTTTTTITTGGLLKQQNNNTKDELSLLNNSIQNSNDYLVCDTNGAIFMSSHAYNTHGPNTSSSLSSISIVGCGAGGNQKNNKSQNNETSPDDILTKPEFTSSMFKNLPVRQKKSAIQHMDNYCLFDPSIDFINEKSLSTSGIGLSSGSNSSYNVSHNNHITISSEYKVPFDSHQHVQQQHHMQRQSFYQNNSGANQISFDSGNKRFNEIQHFQMQQHEKLTYSNDDELIEEIIYDETADAYTIPNDEVIYNNVMSSAMTTGSQSDNDSTYHNYFTIDTFESNDLKKSQNLLIENTSTQSQIFGITGQQLKNSRILNSNLLKEQFDNQNIILSSSTSSTSTQSVDDTTNQQQYLADSATSSSSSTSSTTSPSSSTSSSSSSSSNSTDCKTQNQSKLNCTSVLSKSLSSVNSLRDTSTTVTSNQKFRSNRIVLIQRNSNELNYRNRTIPIESNCILLNSGQIGSKINNKTITTIKSKLLTTTTAAAANTISIGNGQHQYKIRKPRPLSTNSDADSGFLSPNSPDELKFNPALLMLEQCDSIQGYIEIYTDWANYYLERAKSKRKVTDLSADCRDGLLLADVIEAVTSFKVPDLIKKPKNQQQMYDNVNSCLTILRQHSVGGLDNVTTNDICSGRLKAVLALFFALSRFKQQSKQQQRALTSLALTTTRNSDTLNNKTQQNNSNQQQQGQQSLQVQQQTTNQQQQQVTSPTQQLVEANLENGNPDTMISNRQIPVPYSKTNGGTAIPLPATVLVQRRCPPDKIRPLPPTPNHLPCLTGKNIPNGGNELTSPQKGNNNGLRQPQCKIPSSPYNIPSPTSTSQQVTNNTVQQNAANQPPPLPASNPISQQTAATKHSMLEKLKLFKSEKTSGNSNTSTKSQVSKRTSSSSGFSSARSERSDSSLSLNDVHNHQSHIQQQQQLPPPTQLKPPTIHAVASASTTPTGNSPSQTTIASTANQRTKEQNAKKQSKLFSSNSGNKKDSLSTSSASKQKDNKIKEKSPARHTKDDELKSSGCGGGGNKSQKAPSKLTVVEQQKLKSSSKLSLNSTKSSDSKSSSTTNVNQQQQQNSNSKQQSANGLISITNFNNGSGIPKPMAAVKGTTKTVQITIEKSTPPPPPLHPKSNQEIIVSHGGKTDKQDISVLRNYQQTNDQNNTNISTTSSSSSSSTATTTNHLENTKTNIVVPLNMDVTGQQLLQRQHSNNNIILGSATNNSTTSSNHLATGISNGPILYNKILQQQQINNISMSDSLNSTSTTNSVGLHSNSSESSVIYRPGSATDSETTSTSNNTTKQQQQQQQQQIGFSYKKFDQLLLQQQQQQIAAARKSNQQLKYQNCNQQNKFNTVPSKMGPNSHLLNSFGGGNQVVRSHVGTIFEEDKNNLSILPMRPLLRGYNSHVTLPTRGSRSGQHFVSDFCDSDLGGAGYMSDGDSLRHMPPPSVRYSDIDNGYLSEGSIGGVHNQNYHHQHQHYQHHNQHHHHQNQSHSSKHFLNIMRGRQLPTTIEERVRGSRGSLESISTAPSSINSVTTATALSNNNNNNGCNNIADNNSLIKMDINGIATANIMSDKSNLQQQHHHQLQQHHQQINENSSNNRSSSRSTALSAGNNHHNNRDNWHKISEPLNSHQQQQQQQQHQQMLHQQAMAASSPNPSRKDKSSPSRRTLSSSSSSSSKQSSSGRTKGVPQSFGYVKRSNGSSTGTITTTDQQGMMLLQQQQLQHQQQQQQQQHHQQQLHQQSSRTAHVSAVPRSGKIKVSGGTQTCQNDLQTKIPPNVQHRSFSLTGPGATQLSQSIRERLGNGSHSLPKPGSDMHMFQHRIANRNSGKILDGSLSDTQTYAEVKPEYSTYALWLKHSSTTASRLSEGDSIESIQHIMGSPGMQRHSAHKLMQRNVALNNAQNGNNSGVVGGGGNTGTANNIVGVNPPNALPNNSTIAESAYVQSPRMNRSNSISYLKERTYPRSTKSEKMYPTSMLSRGSDAEMEPYYCLPVGTIHGQNGILPGTGPGGSVVGIIPWSQPTSPTPPHARSGYNSSSGPLSPTQTLSAMQSSNGNGTGNISGIGGNLSHRLTYPKKNDEVHGSSASLLSGGSSLYGSAEERQANEVRRLKRELTEARDQVMSLSSQLSTNAHVVAAFEQSLSNMTQRLQQLTATAERKDGELTDMRQTIELLRKQSIQAGLTTAHMQSMGVQQATVTSTNHHQQSSKQQHENSITNGSPRHMNGNSSKGMNGSANGSTNSSPSNLPTMQRHHSSDSMCSLNSLSSGGCSVQDKKKKKGWLRSSFTKAFSRNAKISKTNRHVSDAQSNNKNNSEHNSQSSSNQNSIGKEHNGHHGGKSHSHSGHHDKHNLSTLPPPSPTKNSPQKQVTIIENAKPVDAIDVEGNPVVEDLKKQLREKDLVLTDIRLEALSSASQLESLKDTVMKMRAEMLTLKQNNERLQKLVTSRSLAGSEVSLGAAISPNGSIGESRRYSLADSSGRPPMELPKSLDEETEEENIPPAPAPEPPPQPSISPTTHIDLTPPPPAIEAHSPTQLKPTALPLVIEDIPDITDGKKISIAVYLGQPESFSKYLEEIYEIDQFYEQSNLNNGLTDDLDEAGNKTDNGFQVRKYSNASLNEFVIAYTYISGKTTWQNLDYIVRKTFKDYVARIDPGTNLGLNTDSITSYHLGEAKRGPEVGFPELLPCGYIIGNVKTLYICLQGVGSLAFDSLIPRSIVHRYITLLTEHRRLILCGPSGTGKSYLARKLAEFLVARSGRCNISEAIATFNVDHKSSKELRQYLSHVAEQASMANGASELPSVIILDNLHHASALGDVFSSLLSCGPAAKLPCIIGTMSQATCNTTNLQLHHNFRWVLTANHMEPVKGFLGRFLRRRLFTLELQTQLHQQELSTVLSWLPTVWQHINRFLENHSSSDVTIGPRLFLTCPLDLKDSQVWFTDIWNYHLAPYLVEAVREGVQLYGRRGGAWNDPSTFIRDTYPWQYGPDSVPPLRQINAEDVGLEGTGNVNNDSQDPLLNMLMRLQEAANYSENQEQESDCASLDSNITPDSSAGNE